MKRAVVLGMVAFLFVAVVLIVAVVSTPSHMGEREEPTFADVAYGPHERNVLDFWQAPSDTPTPLIVWIHGGGFLLESKDEFGRKGGDDYDIRKCWKAGVSVAAIDYRFLTDAPLQDIMRDCGRAIQFLRHKAQEWNIDKTRIASFGGSAGAGTSLWLAFHDDLADPDNADPVLRESTRLCVVGAIVPQATYDFSRWPKALRGPQFTWWFSQWFVSPVCYHLRVKKTNAAELRQVRADLDMLAWIDPEDPPVFIRSSGKESRLNFDFLHHPWHARALEAACKAGQVPCIAIYRDTPPEERVNVLDFLLEHLRSPDRQ